MSLQGKRVLLVCSPYYPDIVNAMVEGAKPVLEAAGVTHDRIDVPGVFELPAAVKTVSQGTDKYNGFITFGCVIRGETDHYDHICRESSRAIMDLTTQDGLAIGFGVLTCETAQQAIVRADPEQKNKGREAATACIAMMELKLNPGGGS